MHIRAGASGSLAPLVALLLLAGPAHAACAVPAATAEVVEVGDDGTIRLADRRDLRLAGVELTEAGRAALPGLVGREIVFHPLGRPDRWNRQPAHSAVEEKLVRDGLAHAAAQAPGACLEPLLAAEARARSARSGLWGSGDYIIPASDGDRLTTLLGAQILAEGKVVSARTHQGRVYLNFARYWKTGLSLIIAEKDWPLFAKGAAVETIAGKRLRVRGRLEYRLGPAVLAGPDDRIEILP